MRSSSLSGASTLRLLIAYYATLLILTVVAFFPNGRVWGFNWWGYYPVWVPVGLLTLGTALTLLLLGRIGGTDGVAKIIDGRYLIAAGSIAIVTTIAFVTLFARTHFLGDGYLLISLGSAEQPLIKWSEIGESLAHVWVRNLFGGANEWATEMGFRAVSITAGILFIIATLITTKKLFAAPQPRVLFLLGTLSGGYLLLYFGYVENYSLFTVEIVFYTYLGIFVAKGRISRWWILLPQVIAVLLHIIGVVFLPATIYLIMHGTRSGKWIAARSPVAKAILGLVGIAVVASAYAYAAGQSVFFRLAILTVTTNKFTRDGYTLFAGSHLIDIMNLLFLLSPGILVFLASLKPDQIRSALRTPAIRFLLLAIVCGLCAVFVFDPKLGMPRDWDLFSFAGIPITVLCFMYLLDRQTPYTVPAALMIALGLVVLGPRVVSQVLPEISIAHALNYKDMDPQKSKALYVLLTEYMKEHGDHQRADHLIQEFNRRFPEIREGKVLASMVGKRTPKEIIDFGRRILNYAPLSQDVWANMGFSFISLNMLDSAIHYYEIADGLNPGDPSVQINLAAAYLRKGDLNKAGRLLDEALSIDSTKPQLYYFKSRIAMMRGDKAQYLKQLSMAASWPNSPLMYLTELCEVYLRVGQEARARSILNAAIARGLDSAVIESLANKYPTQLGYLRSDD